MMTLFDTIIAIVVIALIGLCVAFTLRIIDLECRISDLESKNLTMSHLERRIEQVAEVGKILNRQLMELDSRGRMRDRIEAVKAEHSGHSHVTQEQVDEAKTRAKL